MDEVLVDRWRAQTGASILGSVSGPDAVTDAGDGWWLVLFGMPSADGNIAAAWEDAGAMPFMAVELRQTPHRVRHAGASRRLVRPRAGRLAAGRGVRHGARHRDLARRPVLEADRGIVFWLLQQDGEDVSTVMTARYADVVTVCCMATRAGQQRKGFGRALLAHARGGAGRRRDDRPAGRLRGGRAAVPADGLDDGSTGAST